MTFRGLWPHPLGRSGGMTLRKILVISSILEPKINCQRSQNYELRQRHPKILQNSNINVKTCKRLGKMLVIMGMYSMHLLITEEKNVKNVVFLNYGLKLWIRPVFLPFLACSIPKLKMNSLSSC